MVLRSLAAVAALAASLAWAVEDPEEVEARLEALRAEIEAIQQRLDRDLGTRDEEMERLANAERAVSARRRATRRTESELAETRSSIDEINNRIEVLEGEVTRHAHALARQLALAYRHGSGSRLKMLLNQDDPTRFSRRLAYHGYLTRARLDAMDKLSTAIDELAESRASLEQERLRRETLLEREREELAELEQARAERAEALAVIEARIENNRDRLADLERDAAELAELLEELASALADVPPELEATPFAELRGELPRPVDGPIEHGFGDRRGGEVVWNGWLIAAEQGERVGAIAHGRVAYAEWLRGYGLLLIVDHGDGFMSLYAHNESLLRDVGDWVSPGETIATVGNSGGTGEAGLYFELRRNGEPVDPVDWLER